MVTVNGFSESAKLAQTLADHVVKAQNDALSAGSQFNVAVSGGSLVKTLRIGLKDRQDVKWDKWVVYFADERLVPLDHADSNYGLLKTELLDHLSTKPKVHTVDESLLQDSSAAASQYATVLPAKFDLILLGCGPDGHTCSLFPGHALLKEESVTVAAIEDSPKPPPRRITLTFPVLKQATELAFVAEGAGKAPVLKQIFEQPELGLPATMVNQVGKQVSWYVSKDAIENVNTTKL